MYTNSTSPNEAYLYRRLESMGTDKKPEVIPISSELESYVYRGKPDQLEIEKVKNLFFSSFKKEEMSEVTRVLAKESQHINLKNLYHNFVYAKGSKQLQAYVGLYDGSDAFMPLEYLFPQLIPILRNSGNRFYEIKRAVTRKNSGADFGHLLSSLVTPFERNFKMSDLDGVRLFGHIINFKTTDFFVQNYQAKILFGPDQTQRRDHYIIEFGLIDILGQKSFKQAGAL